jgi:electron transfer flavoprotein alpha subunit
MDKGKCVLVHCEVSNGRLSGIAKELLGIGGRLAEDSGRELFAVLLGTGLNDAGAEAVAHGARKVFVVDHPLLSDDNTDYHLYAVEMVVKMTGPDIVLMGQTTVGKDLAPRLAFTLDTGASMDCVSLEIDPDCGRLLMTKPVYGGNALAVQICRTDPQLATVRVKAMAPAERDGSRPGDVTYLNIEIPESMSRQKKVGEERDSALGIRLEDAKAIVAGGRGIGGEDGFRELKDLAVEFGGVVGGSRPACDNRWVSDVVQIGLTGKVVSPELYIAVGISGSSQHMSGCAGSKVLVAINKDPEANIFNYAHYGIVEDWRKVVPVITSLLKKNR